MTVLVVVTGHPASGKTTLARDLGEAMSVPVLCKDDIKERLYDELGWSDVEWSHKLGAASIALLYDLARAILSAATSVVVEANFEAELAVPKLINLAEEFGARIVQIVVQCDGKVASARYLERKRHPGHVMPEIPELARYEPMPLTHATTVVLDTTDLDTFDPRPAIEAVRNAVLPERP